MEISYLVGWGNECKGFLRQIPFGPDVFAGAGQEKQEKSSMLVHPTGEGSKAGLEGNEMDLGLSGKAGLVAASSRGLGKATALGLAREGVNVTICARGEETLERRSRKSKSLAEAKSSQFPRMSAFLMFPPVWWKRLSGRSGGSTSWSPTREAPHPGRSRGGLMRTGRAPSISV